MPYQRNFKRYELKYLLTTEQKERVLAAMEPYMALDKYGKTTIRNLYFDTDNYRLIRRSIEKPDYKEKLRIRSYALATPESPVFVELKKKFDSVVFKRRTELREKEAVSWLCGKEHCKEQSQIVDEIDYFMEYYENLHPTIFLSYDREAYYTKIPSDFRVTFDDNIVCRRTDLSLCSPTYGENILPEGKVLMEIKSGGGMPLWMARTLSQEKIYKTPFSKYGTAYTTLIFPNLQEALHND